MTTRLNKLALIAIAAAIGAITPFAGAQEAKDTQKQIDELRSALPKFAIPMREVGDRFQNMYFVIKDCNTCHEGMGYGFIKLVKLSAPADQGVNYTLKSEPGDVPK